jgi:hypothetical protein
LVDEIRIDLISCKCIAGEFIFCTDLGSYETILFDTVEKNDIVVSNEVIQKQGGCTLLSLASGGRSIVNTEGEVIYTMTKKFFNSEEELEFVEQFKRSQSFYMKYFFKESDGFGYIKIMPDAISFAPKEKGIRNKLQLTFRLNQSYKSHPQNEGFFN